MFANIRRHQKWLWILISGAVIISFVWYFNPNSRQGQGWSANSSVGTINGRPLTRNEWFAAKNEAEIRYFLSSGSWHGSDEFSRQNEGLIERDTRERLVFKELLKQNNIHVTDEEVANWIAENFGREEEFTPAKYSNFVQNVLAPKNLRDTDFERFVKTQVGIMHLVNVAGLPGKLVTPQEAEAQYRRENEQVSAEGVFFNATNYLSMVPTNDVAIATFYTNQLPVYRIPERVRLAYVEFPASNYFAQADAKIAAETNLDMRIEEQYRRSGPEFFKDTNGVALSAEAAKKRIRENYREGNALVEAQRAAVDLMEELLNGNEPKQISKLEAVAAKRGLAVKVTQPFSQDEGPSEIQGGDRLGESAFRLTASEPFIEQPIRAPEAVYVAGLKDKIESKSPQLADIRERVVADYKRTQSQEMMVQAGRVFHSQLTNAMAGGKSFGEAASVLSEKAIALGPFSQSSPTIAGLDPSLDASRVKGVAFSLKEGETSTFVPARDRGFILRVNKLIPATDEAVKAGLPEFLSSLQRAGTGEAFQEWFNKQAQTIHLSLVNDKSGQGQDGP